MIKKTVKDFIQFLKNPNDEQLDISLKNKLQLFSILLVLNFVLAVVFVFPLLYGLNEIVPIRSKSFMYSETITFVIFMYVLLIPLLEEFLFRYFLRYEGLKEAFISKEKWTKIFPSLVYLFSIGFGLIHITNYLNEGYLFLLAAPLIVLSQLMGGFILSYIRVRLNFFWGVLFHSTWNFLVAIVIPIIAFQFYHPFVKKTARYTISITEKNFYDDSKKQTFKIDSTNNSLKAITIEQYSLQQLLDTLYKKDKYYVDDVLVDLKYNSKDGLTKKEFLDLLKNEYEIK